MREIDAVNVTLEALGESRIVDLNTSNPSAGLARSAIARKRTAVLSTGWWFNQVLDEVTPGKDGQIKVPWAQLSIYSLDNGQKYGERDGMLYDLIRRSKVFSGPVRVRAVLDIDFEDLPEYMAQWIAYETAAEVYMNDLGADSNYQNLSRTAEEMQTLNMREHLRNQRYSTQNNRLSYRVRRGFRI